MKSREIKQIIIEALKKSNLLWVVDAVYKELEVILLTDFEGGGFLVNIFQQTRIK